MPARLCRRAHYDLSVDRFDASPRPVDPEISNGMLRLNDTKLFRVIQVDVVGGGTKTQNAATTINDSHVNPTPNMADNTALPALRSGGFRSFARTWPRNCAVVLADLMRCSKQSSRWTTHLSRLPRRMRNRHCRRLMALCRRPGPRISRRCFRLESQCVALALPTCRHLRFS